MKCYLLINILEYLNDLRWLIGVKAILKYLPNSFLLCYVLKHFTKIIKTHLILFEFTYYSILFCVTYTICFLIHVPLIRVGAICIVRDQLNEQSLLGPCYANLYCPQD